MVLMADVAHLPAIRFASGECAVVATLGACAVLGMESWLTLTLVGTVTVAYADRLPTLYAWGLALAAWALFTGFVTNTYGEPTFDPWDLGRLVLLVVLSNAAQWSRWPPP